MGCDIHGPFLFERTQYTHGAHAHLAVKFRDWGRDYLLFALIADVRNDGLVPAVSEPKGFPMAWFGNEPPWELGILGADPHPDCEAEHSECHGHDADCHSMSWLSTEELIEVQRRYVQYSGYHQPHPPVGRAITYMRMLEKEADPTKYEVRLVFCFDN